MSGEGASYETERQRDDQPPREDLLDPEEIEIHPEQADSVNQRMIDEADDQAGILPDPEERPETQGEDILDAERETEDHSERERGHRPPG